MIHLYSTSGQRYPSVPYFSHFFSSYRCQTDPVGNRAWQVASQQGCEKHHQKEETVQAQRAEK